MTKKLLVGMATHSDFDGTYFTTQALRMYHEVGDIEIAIVDNDPNGAHGQAIRDFLKWVTDVPVYYEAFTSSKGTAQTRNRIFELGTAPYVMVIDPHILLAQGALSALMLYYAQNPDTSDLIQGPLVYDDLKNGATHFSDVWGNDQMWGKWSKLWTCRCGGRSFSPVDQGGRMIAYDVATNDPVTQCLSCGTKIPDCPWDGYENTLAKSGFKQPGKGREPFEIPAMGLGLFSCRRAAWPGFNPAFRGFGGEEWYIHEKFRKLGRQTICLPDLRWVHRFGRPNGVKYPLDIWDKARNYVIGLTELGIPLDRAKASFVGGGKISEVDWEALVRNPDYKRSCGTCQRAASLDDLFARVKSHPRDLDQHADWLRDLASGKRVVAFVKRKEWNVILAAGRPSLLVVHQKEDDALLREVHSAVKDEAVTMTYTTVTGGDSLTTEPQECDLLILDSIHQYERLLAELERHAPLATRVLVRASVLFGERDEGANGPGLLAAIRKWIKDHPEWTVAQHRQEQYGMTLLSRAPEDKTELPSLWKQAANAAKASWRAGQNVLTNFGELKDTEEQDQRLGLCLVCPQHNNGRCGVCGCPIDRKTSFPTEKCPIGRWQDVS